MPVIELILDGDNAWPDLRDKQSEILHLVNESWKVAVLPGGMTSGKPSVALRIDLPEASADGASILVTEMSMAAWIAATVGMRARYPEMFAGTPLE